MSDPTPPAVRRGIGGAIGGFLIGTFLGLLFDKVGLFMAFGLLIGMVLGGASARRR